MRGKLPVVACLLAGAVGIGAGAAPELRNGAAGDDVPALRTELAGLLADQQWPRPKPRTWTVQQAADIPRGAVPTIRRINTTDRVVFLTIDDGYEYDPAFVDIVRRQKIPIMTFLTSTYVKGQGQYFWAMRNAGSRMENHSVGHPAMNTLPIEGQRKEICDASATIAAQYGRRPVFFRPPFGAMNQLTQQAAKDCGIKLIMLWNTEFYNGTTGPGVGFNGFARGDGAGKGFRPGDIVLMHYRKGLAQQMLLMLTWLKQQGFRPAAIENYLPRSLGGNAPDADTTFR
ncbi:polysaccharide deacetylase family protein [Thermomonospora umbrina]|uniref:Peptidoglycan/xylan/chitin deacetylase (PgdA/CDA1 family) n=1 Tax=Thermomonospora umbrina TaxID=111806 RepID=A0A3D9SUK6_9ACTN|nr:polysaccharide deacetylase family protein [Thermomonospora umbrina]REE99626.1 peptidoglycan/xylan/chitin deacetylase (PgdA/CDA1 family) [Thermomonospora umbrina]